MFLRLSKLFLVTMLAASLGLHWMALQTVAWTTMLADNLCHDSVAESVTKTFDGEHPCCLCKAIAAAKKSEKKSEAVSPTLKIEYPPVAEKLILLPPAQFELQTTKNFFADLLSSPPPLPPPRSSFI